MFVGLGTCRFWPIRSYDWGNCEALSSRHSDLPALKKLLFEVMFEELKEHTEQRYHTFRQNTLFNLDDPNRRESPSQGETCSSTSVWHEILTSDPYLAH